MQPCPAGVHGVRAVEWGEGAASRKQWRCSRCRRRSGSTASIVGAVAAAGTGGAVVAASTAGAVAAAGRAGAVAAVSIVCAVAAASAVVAFSIFCAVAAVSLVGAVVAVSIVGAAGAGAVPPPAAEPPPSADLCSLDADGEVTVRHDMSGVTIDDVRRVASQFVGNIEQIPPMVSAVKIDGKRLHELAREGKTVERKPRPVTVHELTIDPTFVETPQDEPDVFRFTTRCGSGTYIRTIAADIGAALGGGAHIRYLRRTAIGRHTEAHASTLEKATIISLAEGLADYRSVILDDDTVARVRNGQRLSEEILTGAGPWVLLDGQGAVVAVHERVEGGKIKPAVVIPAET